ncbi:MAG TPA: RidA family protein [Dongiaceae bacterium]|nr:RidA family protein [Dongiaceae bacterium]
MSLERKNYTQLDKPVGPYVHAVKHGGLVFVSGLTAFGSASQGASIGKQAKEIFRQLNIIAAEENTSLKSLVKVTLFVTSLEGIAELREALFQEYGEDLPASSLVQVAALFSPEINIEIEAVLATV